MTLFPKNINEYLALHGIPRGPNSQVYIVDPANGSDSNPGTNFQAPLATIAAAYALCTANQHDVVLYLAGSSGVNLSAAFVEVVDATGIDRDNTFRDCLFINNSTGNDMASAFVIPAGMGEPRVLLLKDCMFHNVTKLDANDRGVLFGNMNAVTGADGSGVAVQLVT